MIQNGSADRLVLFNAPLIAGAEEKGWYLGGPPGDGLGFGLSYVEVIGGDVMTVYDREHTSGYLELLTESD
jgi:riboflavin biosynthesis pyrimidine reductase